MKPSGGEHYRQLPAPAIQESSAGKVVGSMPGNRTSHDVEDKPTGAARGTAPADENALGHGDTATITTGFTRDARKDAELVEVKFELEAVAVK